MQPARTTWLTLSRSLANPILFRISASSGVGVRVPSVVTVSPSTSPQPSPPFTWTVRLPSSARTAKSLYSFPFRLTKLFLHVTTPSNRLLHFTLMTTVFSTFCSGVLWSFHSRLSRQFRPVQSLSQRYVAARFDFSVGAFVG